MHHQENKQIFTKLVVYQMKNSKGDKTTDYLANYPCRLDSVSQIEKQLRHKLRNKIESQFSFNKDSTGPKYKEQNF